MNAHQRRKARRAERCGAIGCSGRGPLYVITFGPNVETVPVCLLCAVSFRVPYIHTAKVTL